MGQCFSEFKTKTIAVRQRILLDEKNFFNRKEL